jgi:hypothetical protein
VRTAAATAGAVSSASGAPSATLQPDPWTRLKAVTSSMPSRETLTKNVSSGFVSIRSSNPAPAFWPMNRSGPRLRATLTPSRSKIDSTQPFGRPERRIASSNAPLSATDDSE